MNLPTAYSYLLKQDPLPGKIGWALRNLETQDIFRKVERTGNSEIAAPRSGHQ